MRFPRSMAVLSLALWPACSAHDGAAPEHEPLGSTAPTLSWEAFLELVHHEPFAGGVYVVDGDTPIENEKQLREFYETHVADGDRLIVNRSGGQDSRWTDSQKRNLTYCVSDSFGSRKNQMLSAMQSATAAWEAIADVAFVHVASQDSNCTASNPNVLFDVRPVSGQSYLARAFFPGQSRATRNILVDSTAFGSSGFGLTGVLRHELGHALGFRHEHTRPEAGQCFEDNSWRSLTPYDRASVMHYPQCGGSNNNLTISAYDAQGAEDLYGPPGGGNGGGSGGGGGASGVPTSEQASGSLARNAQDQYGPFAVMPGSQFDARITGTGDDDLYVRFGSAPTTNSYNCRPYLNGSTESCSLDVPDGVTEVFVMVRGYATATYQLTLDYTQSAAPEPGPAPAPDPGPDPEPEPWPDPEPPPAPTQRSGSASGSVAQGQQVNYQLLQVAPGTTFRAAISGSGDADLYVRWDAAPTLTQWDCRPNVDGSAEVCELTVPASVSQAGILIYGYSAASYQLDVTWYQP